MRLGEEEKGDIMVRAIVILGDLDMPVPYRPRISVVIFVMTTDTRG